MTPARNEEVVFDLGESTPPSRRDEQRSLRLAELSASLSETISDTAGVLSRVARLVSTFLGDTAAVGLLTEDGRAMQVAAAFDENDHALDVVRTALGAAWSDLSVMLPYTLAIRETRSVLLAGEALEEALMPLPREVQDAVRALNVNGVLLCPLRVHGRVIGTLDLWRRAGAEHSKRDQAFAQELADRAALAIENARLIERLQREVEERRRSEESLLMSAELLQRADDKGRALLQHLVSAQEDERRRIAVDIHDDSIQAMAAVALRLQILRRQHVSSEVSERIAEIEETVSGAITRLRTLLFRLESSSLERAGLERTLVRFIAEVFANPLPRVRVRSELKAEPPGPVQVVLYRIAQEALSNILKHADADEVVVSLDQDGVGVSLVVQDDGVGFDPEVMANRPLPGHLGMRSMHERAQIAGGWLKVESRPGSGTTLRCSVPTGVA